MLVTSTGLEDVLCIGDQSRPELFTLAIRRLAPLCTRKVATTLRLDRDGKALAPLDAEQLREHLRQAHDGREIGLGDGGRSRLARAAKAASTAPTAAPNA